MKQRVNSLRDFQHGWGRGSGAAHTHTANSRSIVHTLFVLLLIATMPVAGWASEGRGYIDMNGGYKTGDFGTPTRSDLYYFSPALGYVAPRYDMSITIPYLYLLTGQGLMQTNTENGIGDIILRAGIVVAPETENGFSLSASAAVKLPTADENKGLGTGETDYAGFLGVHKRIGQNRLTLSAGYIKVGDPSGIDLNNVYVYDVGYARMFTRTELSAWYEGRRSLIPGTKNPQEINVGFFHILNQDYSIKGSSFVGLNNGGPDFGLNLGIVRWF